MILDTSVASLKGTGMMATVLMGRAARFHCRADPLRKANALYYEFEEIGLNKQLGYASPASSINIRNSIGTESRHTSRPLSVISMLPRADAGGLRASTVTYFVLSVSCAIRGHSRKTCDQEASSARTRPTLRTQVGRMAAPRRLRPRCQSLEASAVIRLEAPNNADAGSAATGAGSTRYFLNGLPTSFYF